MEVSGWEESQTWMRGSARARLFYRARARLRAWGPNFQAVAWRSPAVSSSAERDVNVGRVRSAEQVEIDAVRARQVRGPDSRPRRDQRRGHRPSRFDHCIALR